MSANLNHLVQVRNGFSSVAELTSSMHEGVLVMDGEDLTISINCGMGGILNSRVNRQIQSSAARSLLQASLASRYSSIEARDWAVSSAKNGRPMLAGPQSLDISFTHRKNWIGAAFSRSGKIGIDIELIPEHFDPEGWGLFLHPQEIAGLDRNDKQGSKEDALAFWCLKEAWLKASDTAGQVAMTDILFSSAGRLLSVRGHLNVKKWESGVWRLQSAAVLAVCYCRV